MTVWFVIFPVQLLAFLAAVTGFLIGVAFASTYLYVNKNCHLEKEKKSN